MPLKNYEINMCYCFKILVFKVSVEQSCISYLNYQKYMEI